MTSYLALLREDDLNIRRVAVDRLRNIVDTEWIHLADNLDLM